MSSLFRVVIDVACSDARRNDSLEVKRLQRECHDVVTYPARTPGGGALFAGYDWRRHWRRWEPVLAKLQAGHGVELIVVVELEDHLDCAWLAAKRNSKLGRLQQRLGMIPRSERDHHRLLLETAQHALVNETRKQPWLHVYTCTVEPDAHYSQSTDVVLQILYSGDR